MGKSTRKIKQSSHQHVNKYAKFSKIVKPKQDSSDKAKSAARNFKYMFVDKTLDERYYVYFNQEVNNYSGVVDNFEERKYWNY